MFRSSHRLLGMLALLFAACGSGPEPHVPPTTPRTLIATPATIRVQPGEMGTLDFELRGPLGEPLPGQVVSFAIVDDPQTPGAEAQGATLGAVLGDLDRKYPGIRFRMIDEQDRMRRHVRFFINGDQVFDLARPLQPADELIIVQALTGG